ncbi:MAG: 3-oxoacyl-ACP reductase, partial [Limnobacter sp.]|nr:3-oxoacyl-ACP reductase [Limnobacter sp.]
MADKILEFMNTSQGKAIGSALGLPVPPKLKRAEGPHAEKFLEGAGVLVGAVAAGKASEAIIKAVSNMGGDVKVSADLSGVEGVKTSAAKAKVTVSLSQADSGNPEQFYVLDVTGATSVADLRLLYDFFNPRLRGIPKHGRVVVVSLPAGEAKGAEAAAAQSAVPGFVRSLAKESGKNGTTVNLLQVKGGAENTLEGALRFFLSPSSAFVT